MSVNTKIAFFSIDTVAENTDYTQDYLIRLCKNETLDCRKISRVWFVSKESIENYVKEQGNHAHLNSKDILHISEAPGGDARVFLGDMEYVDVKAAESISRYSRDYLTQMAREGAIDAKKISTAWFLNRKSLLDHKTRNLSENTKRNHKNTKYMYSAEKLEEDIPNIAKKVSKSIETHVSKSEQEHKLQIHRVYKNFARVKEVLTQKREEELPDPGIEKKRPKKTSEDTGIITVKVAKDEKKTKLPLYIKAITYVNILLTLVLLGYVALVKLGFVNPYYTAIFN